VILGKHQNLEIGRRLSKKKKKGPSATERVPLFLGFSSRFDGEAVPLYLSGIGKEAKYGDEGGIPDVSPLRLRAGAPLLDPKDRPHRVSFMAAVDIVVCGGNAHPSR